jgi:uncharacterized membrane protein YqjE
MMHSVSTSELGTAELVQRATADARDLVRLEIALARDDLARELSAFKTSAISTGVALVLAIVGVASLVMSLGIAIGAIGALVVGLSLLAIATGLGCLAYVRFPKKPLAATEHRLEEDKRLIQGQLS